MGAGKSKQPKAGKAVSPQPMNNGFGAYPLPPQQQNFGPAYPGGPGSLAPAPGMPLPPQQQFIMPPPQQQFILPPPQQQQNFGPAYPGGPGSLAPAPGMPMSPQGPPQQLLMPGPGLPPPGLFQQGPAQFGPAGFPPQGHHHHHHHQGRPLMPGFASNENRNRTFGQQEPEQEYFTQQQTQATPQQVQKYRNLQ